MGKGGYLGEFELVVMLALARLEHRAYGMTIRKEIQTRGGREVSVPTVYAALERLERKGYISSQLGAATPERGGRAKKYFTVTSSGARAVAESRNLLSKMWDGIPEGLSVSR